MPQKDPVTTSTDMASTKALFAALLVVLVALVAPGCTSNDDGGGETSTITLYGFSVKGEVFDEKVIPAFKSYWKAETGKKVDFVTTYAGSGKITNQVITGAPAEVMILSTEWDALQLNKNGLTKTDWRTSPYNGTLSESPWVILARKGNPKGFTDFSDLTAGRIELVHADPLTSGGACWSIFSVYGSELRKGEAAAGTGADPAAAKALLNGVIDNVISWQSSARNALSQFTLGYGDALITYENEALLLLSESDDYSVIYPRSTIFSEHKAVIVDKNVARGERKVVEAFMEFLFTDEVQRYMTDYGFRSPKASLNEGHSEFPPIELPFRVDYLGGWEKAHADLIDGLFKELKD